METETPLKEGYLLFPPHGVLGHLKKSWHKRYCQLFKSSKHGIERLEVFENEDDLRKSSTVRIITLENCIKITQETQKHPNVFSIVTKSGTHHLATQTEEQLAEWVTAIQSIAFKDNVSKQTIEEDNDLYCSSADGIFTVKLVPSEASARCKLEPGVYTLIITSTAIQLRNNNDHHLLFTWPYRYIRRYGYREGKFTFEAGRKCETGEGTFHLEHSNQQEIFRCLSTKMKSMRKMLSGADTPVSVSAIVCGDNQFQAALSMEARSRSPLPPSPTSATTPLDIDFSSVSSPTIKLPVMDTKAATVSPAVSKPRPIKPPRKNLIVSNTRKGEDLTTDGYDKVEVRREAWRTMGVDDVSHSEQFQESDVEEDGLESILKQASIRQPSTDDLSIRSQGSKILLTQLSHRSDGSSENYDTLQHFGSTSKLNSNPGYRQLPAVGGALSTYASPSIVDVHPTGPTSHHDYDQVIHDIQAFRLADDSHYGYGVIRKKSTPTEPETTRDVGPEHKVYNEMEYAIVHKPKRV